MSTKARRKFLLKSYVTEEEFERIMAASDLASLSLSEYVRRICLGVKVESRDDQQARRDLLKISADLGRLGGLLKQAIAAGQDKATVSAMLRGIDKTRAELLARVKKI